MCDPSSVRGPTNQNHVFLLSKTQKLCNGGNVITVYHKAQSRNDGKPDSEERAIPWEREKEGWVGREGEREEKDRERQILLPPILRRPSLLMLKYRQSKNIDKACYLSIPEDVARS